jgi:hypothetical protein
VHVDPHGVLTPVSGLDEGSYLLDNYTIPSSSLKYSRAPAARGADRRTPSSRRVHAAFHGYHDITSTVTGARGDLDFHVRLLVLRNVKRTVLLDGSRPFYHLLLRQRARRAGHAADLVRLRSRPAGGAARLAVIARALDTAAIDQLSGTGVSLRDLLDDIW